MTKIISPFGALATLSLGVAVHSCVLTYAHRATLPDPDFFILKFVMPLVIVAWLHADYRRSRYWPWFEYDLFVLVAWPVVLLHYLVHTRGVRGLWVYLGLWALWLFPVLCAVMGAMMNRSGVVVLH